MNTLKRGSKGTEVKRVQAILQSLGFFSGAIGGNFGALTEEAVIHFQQVYLGENGRFLAVDGEVGPQTWWALEHPTKRDQSSKISPLIPKGLTPLRQKVLEIAVREHAAGVREVPDGSNSGDGVDKYIKGFGPAYWCMLFITWVRMAAGVPLLGRKQAAHCQTVWNLARERGVAHLKVNYVPIPGDVAIMLYRNAKGKLTGSGHTFFVLRVSQDGEEFNGIEGNAGNRVKASLRERDQGTLIGFINDYPPEEQPRSYERGVLEGERIDRTR
jgi:putative peptidoglycan binding protein/CHAP domain-containing protein